MPVLADEEWEVGLEKISGLRPAETGHKIDVGDPLASRVRSLVGILDKASPARWLALEALIAAIDGIGSAPSQVARCESTADPRHRGLGLLDGGRCRRPAQHGGCAAGTTHCSWSTTPTVFGAIGPTGRGVCEHFGLPDSAVDVKMATLAKALGAAGGFVASTRTIADLLRHSARGYVFSGAMPPSDIATGLAAIKILSADRSRVAHLHHVVGRYRS